MKKHSLLIGLVFFYVTFGFSQPRDPHQIFGFFKNIHGTYKGTFKFKIDSVWTTVENVKVVFSATTGGRYETFAMYATFMGKETQLYNVIEYKSDADQIIIHKFEPDEDGYHSEVCKPYGLNELKDKTEGSFYFLTSRMILKRPGIKKNTITYKNNQLTLTDEVMFYGDTKPEMVVILTATKEQ
jgi:hypothetical protein